MNIENVSSIGATIIGGFITGLIGYAIKKVLKLVAVGVGLFFAGPPVPTNTEHKLEQVLFSITKYFINTCK